MHDRTLLSHHLLRNPRYPALGLALFASLSVMVATHAAPARKKRPAVVAVAAKKKLTGQQIYAQQCASCHGAKGEGTKAYRKPLIGDQSVGQLARFISEAMPPGAPKKCAGPNAQLVASYIYDAFYSPIAQARLKPARVELARLTVGQYRNAVADLLGSFQQSRPWDARRGLRGEYYKTARPRRNERILERVDPEIRFNFGTTGPLPEADDPYQFSMQWEGSVIAPETGEYEFIVRTEHGAQLWVNNRREPLIDARVKSGNANEYRGALSLIGGRAYPLRLEFSKGVQGVNNLAKLKEKPPLPASLSLEWKPPHRVEEPIPQRCLMPVAMPEVFVVTSPFPPDDRSEGYERGTSISKAWEEATTEGALETAGFVATRLRELSGAAEGAPDRETRLRAFCRQFVERAFRRPLSSELEQTYVTRQFADSPDLETAVKRVVLLTLKSPRFLYRELGTADQDAYAVASRLSFGLWDSFPDAELLKAAAAGQLSTPEQVQKQAERMAADPRTRAKVQQFFLQWLKVDQYPDLSKDPKRFPGFDEAVASDLRTSLELTLDAAVWGERSDVRELFLGDKVYLNGRLAKLYGVSLPADAPFQPVSLEPNERAGVLTHPYVLASFAYTDETSPIHRGVLVARSLLGRRLQPPPDAVTPIPAEAHPNLTTRQRVMLQTKPAACSTCHDLINPLGFTLEKFDAIGRLRTRDNGKPVDTTGGYETRDGKAFKFSGVRDLASYLATSEDSQVAFVEQLFQHLVKQPAQAFGPQTLQELRQTFATNNFDVRKQLVETMLKAALKQ